MLIYCPTSIYVYFKLSVSSRHFSSTYGDTDEYDNECENAFHSYLSLDVICIRNCYFCPFAETTK